MTWTSETPSAPEALTTIGNQITAELNSAATTLRTASAAARAASLFALQQEEAAATLANLAIQTAIRTINGLLDTLLDSTGVYVLPIPLPKLGLAKYFPTDTPPQYSQSLLARPSAEGQQLISAPTNALAERLPGAARETLEQNPVWQQFINPSSMMLGGNPYILKTISEALYDRRDVNRPRLTGTAYWGYMLSVAGASDVTALMNTALYFSRLIRSLGNSNTVSPDAGLSDIVPENVTATLSGRGGFAVIQWDPIAVSRTLRSYDDSTVTITKYAVIRAKGLQARTARGTEELFTGNAKELTQGQRGLFDAVVLKVADYDSVTTRYVDESDLEENTAYYYFVAFATKIVPAISPVLDVNNEPLPDQAITQAIGFNRLSSAAEFRKPSPRENPQLLNVNRLGTAPDWMKCAGAIGMVPPLNRFIGQLQEFLNGLASRASNLSTVNSQYIAFLNRQVALYESRATEISQKIQNLTRYFDPGQLQAGLHTTFRTGSGATPELVADVAIALGESNDPDWPPFTQGDEFVTGFMALAVAPNAAAIDPVIELLKLLFAPTADADPVLQGIESINTDLAAAEANLIAQITGGSGLPAAPANTFNQDLTPRAPGQGDSTCD